MGRGAIPSRRGFSRGAMRHPGVSGITRPFGRLSRGRGQVLHVLLSRSPLASLRRGVPFDLHVLGAPPAFILSQDRTLRLPCGTGVSGITRPFGRLSRGGGRFSTCYSAVRHSLPSGEGCRYACVRRAASVHRRILSVQNMGLGSSGPLSHSLIGSVRFIWFCLIGKGISRGRLSAALRKTNPSQTISNGSMSARMRH